MKCKAMGRSAWRALCVSYLAAWVSYLPVPLWLSDAVNAVTLWVFVAAAMTFAAWLLWNLPEIGAKLRRTVEAAARETDRDCGCLPAGQRQDGTIVCVRSVPSRAALSGEGELAYMMWRAYAAGTVSVNGKRLPSGVTLDVATGRKGTVRRISAVGSSGGHMLSSRRTARSKCDVCERPMETAWCEPQVPYLCRSCKVLCLQFRRFR